MLHERIRLIANRDDVTLTTYVLDDSPEMLGGKSRGAVLICPGGAYLNCSDREAEPIAMKFASMGYHAFVLRYSVHTDNRPGYFPDLFRRLPINEHSLFPNPLHDIGRAMLYIKDNASRWLVDPGKIAICGFSAGGHNCAMYSVYWNKPLITDYFGVDAERLKPAACILGYPLTDYVFMKDKTDDNPTSEIIFNASNTAYFGTTEPTDKELLMVSPSHLVDESTPPTFLWATSEDSLVPVQHTTHMANALADKNIPFEMHVFESGPHGLSTAGQSSAGAQSEIDDNAARWIYLCDSWLKKRFAFELPEKRLW